MLKMNLKIILTEEDGKIFPKAYESNKTFYNFSDDFGNVKIEFIKSIGNLDIEMVSKGLKDIKSLYIDFGNVEVCNFLCVIEDCLAFKQFKIEKGIITYLYMKSLPNFDFCMPMSKSIEIDDAIKYGISEKSFESLLENLIK